MGPNKSLWQELTPPISPCGKDILGDGLSDPILGDGQTDPI